MPIFEADATLARTRTRVAQTFETLAEMRDAVKQSRMAVARSYQVLERLSACAGEPPMVAKRARPKRPKRNKLFYKHRWLISRDVVAALRRAGVVCGIVVPEQVGWKQ
jgi:hypothetical protein